MQKLLFVVSFLLSCFATSQAQDVAQALLITKSDESCVSYLFKDNPVIVFNNQTLEVRYKDTVDSFLFTEVTSVSYVSEHEATGIGYAVANDQKIIVKVSSNGLTIVSPTNSIAKVYDMNGTLIKQKNVKGNSSEFLDFKQISKGIYILSIGSLTFKFAK